MGTLTSLSYRLRYPGRLGIIVMLLVWISCGSGSGGGNGTEFRPEAAAFYVSPSGNDNSSGSLSAPFKTIQKAANIVSAGDTVIVKDGVYTDTDGNSIVVNLNRGGTPSAWVTFRSENVWGAVVDCQGRANWGWNFESNAAYVRIEGFEVTGCVNDGMQTTAASHNLILSRNHVHHIGNVSSDSKYGKNAFYAGSSAHHIILDRNLVHHIGRIADSACANSTPSNVCYNHDHGFYIKSDDTDIINNVVYETKAGWGVQLAPGAENIRIINNTFSGANPGRDGQIILWGGQENVIIRNNIFSQPRTAPVRNSNCLGDRRIMIQNNLTTAGSMVSGDASCLTLLDNLIASDPLFLRPMTQDFRLQEGSPAVDRGMHTGAPLQDFEGNTRPQGAGIDLGAYER